MGIVKNTCNAESMFTDPRDGRVYKTVKIGEQIWMAENLNYDVEGSRYYEDDPTYYDDDSVNGDKYGRLYTWDAAIKACPTDWHLPTDDEWKTLIDYAGGSDVAGKKLKAVGSWYDEGYYTDEYGFAALPGGYCYFIDCGNGELLDCFVDDHVIGEWWSAAGYSWFMRHTHEIDEGVYKRDGPKTDLRSVRCVQNRAVMV